MYIIKAKLTTHIAGFVAILLVTVVACTSQSDEFKDMAVRVAKLNIHRNDYTLAKILTGKQKETARLNAVEATGAGTYKFKDNDLYVVVDKTTDRVLILYEQYEPASGEKIRELVGKLFFDFGDPTVMAHDKTIYWAFDEKGKISEQRYRETKKKREPLKTLATVKLNSSEKIMDKSGPGKDGSVYYIVSSEPILKILKARGE